MAPNRQETYRPPSRGSKWRRNVCPHPLLLSPAVPNECRMHSVCSSDRRAAALSAAPTVPRQCVADCDGMQLCHRAWVFIVVWMLTHHVSLCHCGSFYHYTRDLTDGSYYHLVIVKRVLCFSGPMPSILPLINTIRDPVLFFMWHSGLRWFKWLLFSNVIQTIDSFFWFWQSLAVFAGRWDVVLICLSACKEGDEWT